MTDEVLEISLKSPRPNFLQLLAQPEMAIVRGGQGSGPYRAEPQAEATVLGSPAARRGRARPATPRAASLLRGERAAAAVARFAARQADLVLGGTLGDLPLAARRGAAGGALRFDPVGGLFGLAFPRARGAVRRCEIRQALAMAIDRPALAAALGVPGLQPRKSLLPPGVEGLPGLGAGLGRDPLPARRGRRAGDRRRCGREAPLEVRVAMPDGPGYRLLFAHLRRDWAAVGVEAVRVPAGRARRPAPDRRGRAGRSGELVSAPFHLRGEPRSAIRPPTR